MFTVIGCMIAGIFIGYAARRIRFSWISHLTTGLIWILLFLLGWEVGHNQKVISALPALGLDALLLTVAALLGSCLLAWGLWRKMASHKHICSQEHTALATGEEKTNKERQNSLDMTVYEGNIYNGKTKNEGIKKEET